MRIPEALADKLSDLQRRAIWVGAIGLGACLVGAFFGPQQFFRSYLLAYQLWIGIAVGSLAVLMLHHLTGGEWGFVIRRVLESSSRTLPVMALLFLPLLLGLNELYAWTRPDLVAADPILQAKSWYLNVPFYLVRALVYFAVWIGLSQALNRWSRMQERGEPVSLRTLQRTSAAGLVLYVLTITFAAVDWIMSLQPHWFSTIIGLLFIAAQGVAAFAFAIVVLRLVSQYEPFARRIGAGHFHDLGNLLFAFVILWAYMAFSQWLIIWAGNLPEEIAYYLHRAQGSWRWVGLVLIVFHFAVPFLFLLFREVKRHSRALAGVALGLLLLRVVDMIWLVEPAFTEELRIHWMDVAAPVGLGGVWLAVFLWQLKKMPLLPGRDPRFALETNEAWNG